MSLQVTPSTKAVLGSLSSFRSYDETSHIGTRFPDSSVQLSKLLKAENTDELIRDLATLVSHRGVVFFTDQDISVEDQRTLGSRLGELTGKPVTSGLHTHPITEVTPELSKDILVIASERYAFHRMSLHLRLRLSAEVLPELIIRRASVLVRDGIRTSRSRLCLRIMLLVFVGFAEILDYI
jgi:Taurine catabolism dioxygenase TauD, TfdA family